MCRCASRHRKIISIYQLYKHITHQSFRHSEHACQASRWAECKQGCQIWHRYAAAVCEVFHSFHRGYAYCSVWSDPSMYALIK